MAIAWFSTETFPSDVTLWRAMAGFRKQKTPHGWDREVRSMHESAHAAAT
jgi:hypothetical protein